MNISHKNSSKLPPAVRGPLARRIAWARRGWLLVTLLISDQGPRLRRSLDVVAAGVGLALLGPVLGIVALLIRWTSPGAVLFSQERIGRNGRRFRLYKFRTMYVHSDSLKAKLSAVEHSAANAVRFKLKHDPRVTPIGRWLRRYSIDELPQLFNVLRGDMTLIGPRPALHREVRLYDAQALRRLEVDQGLTCLWQVQGRSELTFEQQVQLDIEYIDKGSYAQNLKILLKTIPAVVTGRGAY